MRRLRLSGRAGLPRGEGPWPWLAAGSLALSLLMLAALLLLLAGRGLGHFWPAPVELVTLDDGRQLAGQPVREERRQTLQGSPLRERLYRTGNRDLDGEAWRWVEVTSIARRERPDDWAVIERQRWGELIVRPQALEEAGRRLTEAPLWAAFAARLERVLSLRAERDALRREVIAPLARRLAAGHDDAEARARLTEAQARVGELQAAMTRDALVVESAAGEHLIVPLESMLAAWRPNAMSPPEKLAAWGANLWHFLSEGPRAANTAGGVWPAIFGTVLMVLLMSALVTPFGVLAAVYLHEVAPQGRLTGWVRIAVRNLAGVPSIVYGVFGLGVFVYGIGGRLDDWLFADSLPSPTFGTGGLLWASLTLALLTLPVVIVATEEGLARIPAQQREAALALGATRAEMLRRVILPMAMPAMLTGVILAIARAAGEVAPLMLVGVAKLAPQVPVDGDFPYLHLERKFMHLGYHVFDVGFHSGDVEAALPLVYATALLLVGVILVLNLTAILLRHHLRARHAALRSR
ncbi:phosphate ABC transporter permease PstA [Halomonas sp. H5]|uniref:phosphate ABC transporter permease PstA n=1 Tax=Halomonas sp. H5 TaxID=3423910 RepID=UPI003D35C492